MLGYMAIDQYNTTIHLKTLFPRKELLEYFDRQHADIMYRELKAGGSEEIGYIIAGHWLTIYRVSNWKEDI